MDSASDKVAESKSSDGAKGGKVIRRAGSKTREKGERATWGGKSQEGKFDPTRGKGGARERSL